MAEKTERRSRVYAGLSIGFSPPREALGAPGGPQALVRILREAMHMLPVSIPGPVFAAMEEGVAGIGELDAEYNRLFVGPGTPRVYPYESLYRDSAGLVMGPAAREVLQAYYRSGFVINAAYRDLPDHIAVEFEFMARLCTEEAEAAARGRPDLVVRLKEEQASFLRAHLCAWVPALCEKLLRETSAPFYRGLAEITSMFVCGQRTQTAGTPLSESEMRR